MTATSPQQRFWIRWLRFYRTNPYFQARWGLGTILILLLFILLAVTATNTIVFGAPTSFSPEDLQNNENKITTCDNTQQGRIFVTDDKGNVCKWKHVDPLTKCCTELYDSKARAFSCENCNISTSCCSVYEFCVSCCMDPAKEDLRNEISEFVSEKSALKTATNSFQFCRAICRTSSRSIHSHNRYRDEYKHCYTLESPPINNETNPLDSRKSHESELEANEDDTSGKDKLKDKHKDKLKDELKKTVLPTETSTGSVVDALEVEVNETKKEEVKEFTEVEGLVAMDTNMNNNNKWEFGAARTFSSGHSLAQEVAHHLRLVLLIILFLFT